MSQDNVKEILENHQNWMIDYQKGKKANFRECDLSNMDLSGYNFFGVDFSFANLWGANLTDSVLCYAHLFGASLSMTNLQGANLQGAVLDNARMGDAKNVPELPETLIVPQTGSFHGWKKCYEDVLVKLEILEDARRSSATTRKCRAEAVKVLEVIGSRIGVGVSTWDARVKYRAGEIVRCDKWESNRWVECGGGIHFFLTREEAERY
jgi:uncharacterized protein YjbI with pentapeptide repeats